MKDLNIFAPAKQRHNRNGMGEKGIKLVVAGVNYRKAALEIRNKFALTSENISHIYSNNEFCKPDDFFIISTCNRTEIYCNTNRSEDVIALFSYCCKVNAEEITQYIFVKSGEEAIKHLFYVASGLDSQILGDYEITGQLKNAFFLAKANNYISGFMEKLVNSSLQASRKVRNRTSISDGTTSISYAIIQLLKQEVDIKKEMNICLMGLGKIGTLTLKNLKNYLPGCAITLINRNAFHAQSLANDYQVSFAPLKNQHEVLNTANILIVATGADHPIITKQEILSSQVRLIFDLSVPSNVSNDVKEISEIKLYNIDSLSQIVNNTIGKRVNEIPVAKQIIEEHVQDWKKWEKRRELYRERNEA